MGEGGVVKITEGGMKLDIYVNFKSWEGQNKRDGVGGGVEKNSSISVMIEWNDRLTTKESFYFILEN